MSIAIVFFFDLGCRLVNWGRLLILLQWAALLHKHCVDQYMVLFSLLFARADGLHARLCHAFLVISETYILLLLLRGAVRSTVMTDEYLCLFVCLQLAYLRNNTAQLTCICLCRLPVTVARSSCDAVAMS